MFFSKMNKKIHNIIRDEEFRAKVAEEQKNNTLNIEKNDNNISNVQVETEEINYNNEASNNEEVTNNEEIGNNSGYEENIPIATSEERTTIFDNLIQEDKSFSEATFKAKADNIFIQLYTSVMKQDLKHVKHVVSDEVYAKYERRINALKERNELQIYDELNVSDTNITNVVENENEFVLYVNLLTKYLDYVINKDTKAFIRGNKDVREEKRVNLVFTKTKQAKQLNSTRTCPSCGANLDLNKTGVCPYCGSIFELKEYDWILTNVDD